MKKMRYTTQEELMSVEEACQLLAVSKGTLYSLLRSGDLKGFKIGRIWKISRTAINFYIQRNTNLEETAPLN